MPHTTPTRLLALLLAPALVASSPGQESPEFVPAVLQNASGRKQQVRFAEKRVRLRTYAGVISLELRDLRRIRFDRRTDLYTVETVHGDRWLADLLTDELPYYSPDGMRALSIEPGAFLALETAPAAQVGLPLDSVQVIFWDNSWVLLNQRDLSLRVENEAGDWELPLGSPETIVVSHLEETGYTHLGLTFASGRVELLRVLGGKRYFKARDTFGNRLKIQYRDVRQLIRRSLSVPPNEDVLLAAPDTTRSQAIPAGPPLQATITSADEPASKVRVPFAVWTVKGAAGTVGIPMPLVSELGRDETASASYLTTVFGDRFLGKVRPRALPMTAGRAAAPAVFSHTRPTRIALNTVEQPVPQGWLLWRLIDGDLFHARFAAAELEVLPETVDNTHCPALRLPTHELVAIRNRGDGSFLFATAKEPFERCRPALRGTEIVLLCNGMKLDLPWKRVAAAGFDRAELEQVAPTAHRQAMPETGARFRSVLGPLDIRHDVLRAIHHDVPARVSCFETVYGEVFVGPLSVRSARSAAAAASDRGGRSNGVSPVTVLKSERRAVPPGWLACRLTTGDILYARFLEPAISVRTDGGRAGRLDVLPLSLKRVRRVRKNTLAFETTGGEIEGRTESAALEVEFLSSRTRGSLPVNIIDVVQAGALEDLPPPVIGRPGLTPAQRGEVFVPGGSFIMGRTRGDGMEDEVPAHKVSLPPFFMDACEITKAQFSEFVEDTRWETDSEKAGSAATWRNSGFRQRDDEPVVCVSWHDAARFCNWRSEKADLAPCYEIRSRGSDAICHRTRNGYRLPTEAEWEYAARAAGKDILFPWGDLADPSQAVKLVNFEQPERVAGDGWVWTHPAKTFAPNPIGLHAMGGNVWEWCQDWYFERAYRVFGTQGIADPCVEADYVADLTRRVMRGGSFYNRLDVLRCASRGHGLPQAFAPRVGFRCVRNAKAKQD